MSQRKKKKGINSHWFKLPNKFVCSITGGCQRICVILFFSVKGDDDDWKFLVTFFKVEKRENDGRDLIDTSSGVGIFQNSIIDFSVART